MKRTILIIGLALLVGATVLLAGDAVPRASSGSTSVSFAKAIKLTSPALYPSSLAAGDLNGDGIPDLAVVSLDNYADLFYALGKGNGHFRSWRHDGNVVAAGFVLLADVDGDGKLDAITSGIGGDGINIAFDGSKRLIAGGGGSTYIVVVADLNGDGIPDIVGTTSNGIFVILGEGSRKFGNAINFGSGGQVPYGIAVGDLNHDGIPDLVVANYGTEQNGDYGNVAVLLGKGDGTFDQPVSYHAGRDPTELVLGDFNGDSNLDVAIVGQTRSAVNVLLGNGDGTFSSAKTYPTGFGPVSIVAADFNGDGILDLAVTNNANPKPCHVSVLLGNGDGTFQPPVKFRVAIGPSQLVVADFNHDGKPDIATIGGDSTISILLNTTQFPTPPHPH